MIAILTSLVTLAYFLSLQRRVFFGKILPEWGAVKEAGAGMLVPVIVLAGNHGGIRGRVPLPPATAPGRRRMIVMTVVLVLLVLAALWSSLTTLLLRATIALALTSAMLAVVMYSLGATIAAVLELSVCAGLISVVFVSVISLTQRKPFKDYVVRRLSRMRRFWPLPLVMIVAGVALSFVHTPCRS